MSGGTTVIMREVHRLRRFAKDLRDQIERAPRLLKGQQAKVARQEELFREGQEAIKKLKVGVHEMEVTLKTTHTQIAKYQKQLNESAGKKEYDALQVEIATAKAACTTLEDQILAGITEIEERTSKLPELEQAVKRARQEFAEFEKGAGARHANLQAQLAEAEGKLKDVEATIPDTHRANFLRIVQGMGADALASVEGRTCTACYTEITAQTYNDLTTGQFVVCRACGRINYLPESAAVEAAEDDED